MYAKKIAPHLRCLAGVLVVLSISLGAQEAPNASVRATGVVRTTQGIAIPGATLRLVAQAEGAGPGASGRAWITWTDENGKFDIPGLPTGRYRIEAEQIGFEPAPREIELSAQAAPIIELTLRISSLDALNANATAQLAPAPAPAGSGKNEVAKATEPTATKSGAADQSPAPGAQGAPSNDSTTAASNTPEPNSAKRGTGQPGAARRPEQQVPSSIAEMIRQRMRQRGFQEVDLNGQAGAGQEATGPADTGPLGEASSSDAFLISGTVGRGATASGEGGFGPFGGLPQFGGFGGLGGIPGSSDGGGFPGQPGGFGGPGTFQLPSGPGQPQRESGSGGQGQGQQGQQSKRAARGGQGSQGGGPANQTGGFGQGQEALWGMQRVLRQQVNRIRVSVYERYGNSALDARPYSLTETNPAKIPTWRERFGVNVGGPLRIPHVYDGREKTFFFINYNLARTRDSVDSFATVPTLAERQGDFSALLGPPLYLTPSGAVTTVSTGNSPINVMDTNGNTIQARQGMVFRPSDRRAYAGNMIPVSTFDPVAATLLNRFVPQLNLPGLLTQNFHLQTRVPTASDSFNVRVIHTISPKLNAQATYNFNQTHTHAFQNFQDLEGNTSTRGQNLMLGLTQNWTKRLIHDTRVFWNRSRTELLNRFAFGEDIGAELGISGISPDPINFGVPQVSLTNFTDLNDPVPALRRNQTLRFLDNVSYALTKHTLRAGTEIRRMQINTRTDPTPRGAFSFTGLMTSLLDSNGRPVPGTGFDFADFLLGLPQSTSQRFGTSSTYFRGWGFVGYFQDDWRMHPRFSLNWGLRYEAVTPPVELFDHIANLDVNSTFTQAAVVTPGQLAPFSGTLPRSLVRGDYNNWSPRAGIAWKPPFKWSAKHPVIVRAGYGVFYNTSIYSQLAASMANQPPWAVAQTRLTSPTQVLTFEKGFPSAPDRTTTNTAAVDPNYRPGYAQIWNLTIETQLAPSLTSEVTYTGTKGTHLDLLRAPNRGSSNALGYTFDTYGASSTYHALQLRLQRRFARGFMLQGLYTFGKSIDNASSIGGGAPVVVQDDTNFALERGLSSFDIRHQFRANYVYELPFGERKRWARKGWEAAAFGNWTLSGNTIVQTGTPFTARVLGGAVNNGGVGATFSTRADQVGDPSLPGDQRTPLHFFNTAAFLLPSPGRFGDAARNTIPGPGNFSFNFALARRVNFGKDKRDRINLRWEVQNLTNTPSFTGLSTVVNSQTYGRVLGVRAMRTMDFVMRVNF